MQPPVPTNIDSDLNLEDLVGNEDEFPVLRNVINFNHAGVCPLPARVVAGFDWFCEKYSGYGGMDEIYDRAEACRPLAASFLNCQSEEIAFIPNTSTGLGLVARGLDWARGGCVVTTSIEFPANRYVWEDLPSRRTGSEIKFVTVDAHDDGSGSLVLHEEDLIHACKSQFTKDGVNLLAISIVQFATGQRLDVKRLAAEVHDLGGLVCVDGIQALGAYPMDVAELGIDFLSADGHKWMLGPEGCGIFYCRREHIDRLNPMVPGWLGMVDSNNYDRYLFEYRPDARRFEPGAQNVAGMLGFAASLHLLSSCGLDRIARRLQTLSAYVHRQAEAIGCTVTSPDADPWNSGIVMLRLPESAAPPATIAAWLRERDIVVAARRGHIRVSPHFYNTETQIDHLCATLAQAIETL